MQCIDTRKIKELKNELSFIKSCIKNLKQIKKWNIEDKKIFYELLKKKKSLEVKINGLTK